MSKDRDRVLILNAIVLRNGRGLVYETKWIWLAWHVGDCAVCMVGKMRDDMHNP